jgi:hypothetical protein
MKIVYYGYPFYQIVLYDKESVPTGFTYTIKIKYYNIAT